MVIRKDSLYSFIIFLFPLCYLLRSVSILSYYDELVGTICTLYVLVLFIQKRLSSADSNICLILIIITIIGLISNIFSGLTTNLFAIVIDALWLWKTFACYIAFKHISKNVDIRWNIIYGLQGLAKCAIIIVFITSIIGQVVDIGVTGDYTVYGLKQFIFWGNSMQTGWLLFCCLMILAAYDNSSNSFTKYYILCIVPALLTFSSLVYCFFFIGTFLLIVLREDDTFKIRYIIILAIGIAIFAAADIQSYFFSESVRMKLIQGGIRAANSYFPFGAGFANYGSEMSVRYYSELYVEYGWENTWGLGRTYNQYLNDNFFAGIIGEFGWIGFTLYLLSLFIMFKEANSKLLDRKERCMAIACILTMAVVMIGSASAKSVMGVCTFAVLGIICSKNSVEEGIGELEE